MKITRSVLFVLFAFILGAGVASAQSDTSATDETSQVEPIGVFQGAGILIFKSDDDRFQWWLDGRINLDTAFYLNSDNDLTNGVELRRGRFALNMVLWKDWAAQLDIDFVENAVDVKDVWIGYTGLKNTIIRAGNFRSPFGLETLTSSRYITFMERALIDNFSPDRRMGLGVSTWGDRWQASGGFFGPELEDTIEEVGADQTYSLVGRVTALPYARGNNVVHLGLAGARMQPSPPTEEDRSDANRWRVRARPESHVSKGRFISTPQVRNVDHADLLGLEAAATFGSLSVQAEYNREILHRTDSALPEPKYDGGYVYVSYFLTGDHRPYDRSAGEFGRIVPKGSRGAFEIAARYSVLDLNDPGAGITGGRESIVTLAANWYVNANLRFMANYSFVDNDEFARGDRGYSPNDDFNVLQFRIGLMF